MIFQVQNDNITLGDIMETINTEVVVTSLFENGFDRVDPLLFTLTLATLRMDDEAKRSFNYKDKPLSEWFNKTIELDNGTLKLKNGYSLDSEVMSISGISIPLSSMLHTNKKLTEFLGNIDFTEIVSKKASLLGESSAEVTPLLFSEKEKEIMKSQSFKRTLTLNN